jgi:hypothetical protein
LARWISAVVKTVFGTNGSAGSVPGATGPVIEWRDEILGKAESLERAHPEI